MTRDHWTERALGHTLVVLLAITLLATTGAAAPDASIGNQAPTPPNATVSDHLRAATGHGPWSQATGQPQQYAVATQTSSAGAPNVEWSRSLAGTGYDVRQRSDGGYVVAGTRGDDVWVATFDANGTREWSRTYGGGGRTPPTRFS